MADPSDLVLRVDGYEHRGWTAVQIQRSLDSIADSFDLQLAVNLGELAPVEILEDSPCEIYFRGELLLSGYVERGLWLLERGQEPTQLIWVGVALIAGPWLPLTLYRLSLVRSPEMRAVYALGSLLAPALERHGIAAVHGALEQALAQLREDRHDGRR